MAQREEGEKKKGKRKYLLYPCPVEKRGEGRSDLSASRKILATQASATEELSDVGEGENMQ